jgi:hypothetical protein
MPSENPGGRPAIQVGSEWRPWMAKAGETVSCPLAPTLQEEGQGEGTNGRLTAFSKICAARDEANCLQHGILAGLCRPVPFLRDNVDRSFF